MTRIRFGGFGYDPSQSLLWDAPVVTGGYTSGEGDWQVVRGRRGNEVREGGDERYFAIHFNRLNDRLKT
jgi:hypothetical protein